MGDLLRILARVVKYNRATADSEPLKVQYKPVELHFGEARLRIGNNTLADPLADRLAACWNFCAGVTASELAANGSLADYIASNNAELTRLRSDLAAMTSARDALKVEVERLRKEMRDNEREFQREARAIADEARWQERQRNDGDYGSY